jgi:hypothetical protein
MAPSYLGKIFGSTPDLMLPAQASVPSSAIDFIRRRRIEPRRGCS